MKKIFFTLIIIIFSVTYNKAQVFGAKAGLNIATFNYSEEKTGLNISTVNYSEEKTRQESLLGFQIGIISEFKILEKFSLQPELIYSKQGTKFNYSRGNYSSERKIKISYINIPLLAKYHITKEVSILVGPQIGFLTSAKYESYASFIYLGEPTTATENYNAINEFKNIDLGFDFGINYKLNSNLFFDARYMIGFSNINDNREYDANTEKNKVISFAMIYNFDF